MALTIREARWPYDARRLEALRREVFIEEQGVPPDIEQDGRDADALHVLAERDDGTVVGCGRLLEDGRIGRLAVRRPARGAGIGARMLEGLVLLARQRGVAEVYLHAQADAIAFYERAGFLRRGEPFEEAGITHLDMHQLLDYRDWNDTIIRLRYPTPFDQLVVAQARLARRELAILSPDLDPRLFNREELTDALRRLAREERHARIRVVVMDARALVGRGHALLTLARRIPTKLSIRRLAEHPDWDGDTQVIRDRDSLLALPGTERDPGFYRPGDRARCETELGRFEELWRAGVVDPEFRALSL
jgi:predicted GNAT family N-acyltransferase